MREYKERAQRASEIERQSLERTKTGVFTGAYAENPGHGRTHSRYGLPITS